MTDVGSGGVMAADTAANSSSPTREPRRLRLAACDVVVGMAAAAGGSVGGGDGFDAAAAGCSSRCGGVGVGAGPAAAPLIHAHAGVLCGVLRALRNSSWPPLAVSLAGGRALSAPPPQVDAEAPAKPPLGLRGQSGERPAAEAAAGSPQSCVSTPAGAAAPRCAAVVRTRLQLLP